MKSKYIYKKKIDKTTGSTSQYTYVMIYNIRRYPSLLNKATGNMYPVTIAIN